jgi:hypothetical protein
MAKKSTAAVHPTTGIAGREPLPHAYWWFFQIIEPVRVVVDRGSWIVARGSWLVARKTRDIMRRAFSNYNCHPLRCHTPTPTYTYLHLHLPAPHIYFLPGPCYLVCIMTPRIVTTRTQSTMSMDQLLAWTGRSAERASDTVQPTDAA